MNTIDLSKISVKTLPQKTVKANFDGTEKDYTVRTLNDGEKMSLDSILATSRNVFRARDIYVLLLSAGLDIDQNVAAFIFDNVNAEAIRVGDLIFDFTKEFDEAKKTETEQAEKN